MDARRDPRTAEGPAAETETPPLSGDQILLLHNARTFGLVIARLLGKSDKDERARERREFIRRAAQLSPPSSVTAMIKHLHARLQKLAALPLPGYLDSGMADDVLCVVLLIGSGKAPSLSTVQRALTELHMVGGSDSPLL